MAADSIHALRSELETELPAHGAWVRGLARSLVRDDPSADDIAQEAALAAWRRRGAISGALAPWLARATRNFARRNWREAARRAAREQAAARTEALPGADEAAARLEIQRILVTELGALEPRLRHVLVRRYFDGWSAARIARESGEPAPTVRWRVQRALAELRARLDTRNGGDGVQWRLALLPACGGAPWLEAARNGLDSLRPMLGAMTIEGALTMKAASQALVAVGVVAAVGLGVWWSAADDEVASPSEAAAKAESVAAAPDVARDPAPVAEPVSAKREVLPTAPVQEQAPHTVAPKSAAARVTGRTVDEGLVPVADARISQVGADAAPCARSSSDGTFELEVEPENGTCTVRVEADGFATQFVESTPQLAEPESIGDVVLAPGGSLRGRVFGADGAPFAGATVSVTRPDLWGSLEDARVRGPFGEKILTAASGNDGRFEIDGVGVGPMRAWAGAAGMRYAVSPPIEVRARQATDEVELVLEPIRTDDRIRGIVLSPGGEPVVEASLNVSERAGGGTTIYGVTADAGGRFEIASKRGRIYDLRATDDGERWSSVELTNVQPGTQGIELRFQEARWIELSVRQGPSDVDDVVAFTCTTNGATRLGRATKPEASGGGRLLARVLVPNRSFLVRVDARGFALGEKGPFTPEDAPAALEFELVAEPGVRGRVLAQGEPLAGARVELYEAPDDLRIDHQSYLSLVYPEASDETRTDAAGRFTLKLRKAGTYVVRAEAPEFAAADSGLLELVPEIGRGDLELLLGRGGNLEGRVRVAPGHDPSGLIVAINRGDAHPRTVRTDSEGRFGFEGLSTGPWHLSQGKIEFNPHGGGTAMGGSEGRTVLPFNCAIREGETTYQDLDLSGVQPCQLSGVLRVNGAPAANWGVTAWPGGAQAVVSLNGLPSTATAADGSFALEIDDPGALRLTFAAPVEISGGCRFTVSTEIRPGPNRWEDDFAMGTLSGRCLSVVPGQELGLFYNSAEGVVPSCWLAVQPDESGRYVLPLVPAGKGAMQRLERIDGEERWTTLVETEVLARRERVLDVP